MRQTNLSKRLLQFNQTESFPIIKTLFLAVLLLMGCSLTSTAQTPPAFVAGHHQTLSMCENSPAVDISAMMDITDPDVGDIEYWDLATTVTPTGIVSGFPNANTATGGITSITGITYQPPAGFSGLDSFAVFVGDGSDTDTTMIVIMVNPVPTLSPITGPSIICIGTFSVVADDSTGGVWTSSATGSISLSVDTVRGLSPGIDTVFYTSTLGTCSTMVYKPVTVQPVPVAGSISGRRFVCFGSSITLTDGTPGGTWSATNANATVSAGVVTGTGIGADTIRYTVTNGCGIAVASRVVTVDVVPYVSPISGPRTVCPGLTINLSDPDGGGSWTASNANATVSGTGVVSGVTVGVDTITYSLTLPCGTVSTTYEVSVNTTPDPGVISGPTVVCVGNTITLTETVVSTFWSASNTQATVTSTGDVTGVGPGGQDTIMFTVFGACGSADTTIVINVLPAPNAGAISGLDSVCVGTAITLTETVPGGSWSAGNSNATVASSGFFSASVTGVAAGTDIVSYSVSGSCGTAVATYPITIMPQPVPGIITGPSSVCETSIVVLNDVSPGGSWSASNAFATIGSASGIATGVTAGVDIITYSVTNYCATVTATVNLTVNPQPVAGTISGGTALCVGNTIVLTDGAAGGLWSNSNMHALASSGSISGISLGVDTIVYSVTNMCGTAIASHVVTVNDLAPVNPITGLADVCAGATIALTETTSGGVWGTSGPQAGVSSAGVVSGNSLGVVTISYTVTNMCGAVTQIKVVSVDAAPSAGVITGPIAICPFILTPLLDSIPGGTWSIDNGFAFLDATGHIDGTAPGISVVTYAVANHCGTSSTSFTIRIRPVDSCSNDGVHHVYALDAGVKVFPNPSSGSFSVLVSADVTEQAFITVTNMVGERVIARMTTTNKETPMQVNAAAGMYFVNVYTEHGQYQEKIIIQ